MKKVNERLWKGMAVVCFLIATVYILSTPVKVKVVDLIVETVIMIVIVTIAFIALAGYEKIISKKEVNEKWIKDSLKSI